MSDAIGEAVAVLALGRVCHGLRPGSVSVTIERLGSARAILAGDFTPCDGDERRLRELAVSARVTDELLRRFVAWTDAGLHPSSVLDADYPVNLRALADRPPLLWRRGTVRPEHARALAVVGTRAPSLRGCHQTRRLTTALVRAGITVVSGLAIGIDTVAHHTAITAGGRTLAVLGHGLAWPVYPRENTVLAESIAAHDALFSPFTPDTPPAPATFRARNAITSGLSLGTLVVEAGARSGARLQARLAVAQGRTVYLLRSLHDREPWARSLVERAAARIVDDADDLLAALGAQPFPSGTGTACGSTAQPSSRSRSSTLGVTPRCYSHSQEESVLPTRHDRIPVTKDPELAAALERVAALVPPGTKPATLVRDLALRGADALVAEHRADAEHLERLIARNLAPDPGFDRDLLRDIDREAWGLEP